MKIISVEYNKPDLGDDSLSVYFDNGTQCINIDMDFVINEIALQLKKDYVDFEFKQEFNYLIDDNFDCYLNPDNTLDIRITDHPFTDDRFAYHVTINLEILIEKQRDLQDGIQAKKSFDEYLKKLRSNKI